ncbi:MAG: DUF1566 domain-containing protein [Dokdonella sp.]|uniref:Lcl C-terminal domain-containing protein n=1 Tax=Dokdonella sp. TaxID=2291710 RepID=UPI003F821669
MRFIEMIKIGESGEQLPPDAKNHVAVLLPAQGLMFTARVINETEKSQPDLEKACTEVTCAGFNDWSLPEIDELELLIDRSRYSPALNPEYFLDIPEDWLWSKTPAAWSASSAWVVYAYGGYVYNYHRYIDGFALAVRRVGQ